MDGCRTVLVDNSVRGVWLQALYSWLKAIGYTMVMSAMMDAAMMDDNTHHGRMVL